MCGFVHEWNSTLDSGGWEKQVAESQGSCGEFLLDPRVLLPRACEGHCGKSVLAMGLSPGLLSNSDTSFLSESLGIGPETESSLLVYLPNGAVARAGPG